MYTVYVLESLKDHSRYVGSTSVDIKQRLEWHNLGSNRSTKNKRPLKLVYFEEFEDKTIALSREKFFKSGDGRRVLSSKVG